jgi:uncharacterized protein (DUF1800 family)
MPVRPSSDPRSVLAGHVLRRVGFGPSPADMQRVLAMGPEAYIEQQLDPDSIDDSAAEARYLPPPRKDSFDFRARIFRWLSRMQYSRRQLLERMTLVWHEHFATSNDKVRYSYYMQLQEYLFRRNALGSFRKLLVEVTIDQAMLVWLDNDRNNGRATKDGQLIPPNENYARELLQLFSIGPTKLAMDGTPVLDASGEPIPNYTEQDVREVARALTGWNSGGISVPVRKGVFQKFWHDAGDKTILGENLRGRRGAGGAREVEDVVDILMRHPSTAPFIAKGLIQKLATETPTPAYVERVATVFKTTDGNLKATVRAILLDPEFTSGEVVRSQHKTPVEGLVGTLRALGIQMPVEREFLDLLRKLGHLPYYPPSVFSFYRPGSKASLVDTALVGFRDQMAHELLREREGGFDPAAFLRDERLDTPEQIVDALSDRLLAPPLGSETRMALVEYMAGRTTDDAVRGVAWLVLCTPDFHRN